MKKLLLILGLSGLLALGTFAPAGASGFRILNSKTAYNQASVSAWTRHYAKVYFGATFQAGSIVGTGYSVRCRNGFHKVGHLHTTSPGIKAAIVYLPTYPRCVESLSFYSPGTRVTILIAVER